MHSSDIEKRKYHHGNLSEALLEEGLSLIHEQGRENFSLRKLAKRVGVSPTAVYNHYENLESLEAAMLRYVSTKFTETIRKAIEQNICQNVLISMGRSYVEFFAQNPHYFEYLFDSDAFSIKVSGSRVEGNADPFNEFLRGTALGTKEMGLSQEEMRDDILIMWAAVHGLAAMANMKSFCYDKDWGELTERLLRQKILINHKNGAKQENNSYGK